MNLSISWGEGITPLNVENREHDQNMLQAIGANTQTDGKKLTVLNAIMESLLN